MGRVLDSIRDCVYDMWYMEPWLVDVDNLRDGTWWMLNKNDGKRTHDEYLRLYSGQGSWGAEILSNMRKIYFQGWTSTRSGRRLMHRLVEAERAHSLPKSQGPKLDKSSNKDQSEHI